MIFDRVGLAEDREAVERGIVHPNPDRPSAECETLQIRSFEVYDLLLCHLKGNAHSKMRERTIGPRTRGDDEFAGAIALAIRFDLDFAAANTDGRYRGVLA